MSSGNDHLNSVSSGSSNDVPTTNIVGAYNPPESVQDLAYMSNVSNLSFNGTEHFTNYVLGNDYSVTDGNHNLSNSYNNCSAQSSYIPVTSVHPSRNQTFCQASATEDCFDKNSDSAVSSMSSDRINYSDNVSKLFV